MPKIESSAVSRGDFNTYEYVNLGGLHSLYVAALANRNLYS